MLIEPAFTETFKVDEPKVLEKHTDWRRYKDFIKDLRHRLRYNDWYSHGRPILPRQRGPHIWFHIILKTTSHANGITLRILQNNLYLVGYQMENSKQWLEFRNSKGHHLIFGSTFLGFGGSYGDLEKAASRDRKGIALSKDQLTTAVNDLAISKDSQVRALSLIIVIQMISESIRFDDISNCIIGTSKGVRRPEMLELENGWGDLSSALLRHDADPVGGFLLPQSNKLNIRTADEAARAVGILLGLDVFGKPPNMVIMVRAPVLQVGRPLVEVFSLVRKNSTGGKLYGTITVTDGVRCQYIYNQKRDEGDSGSADLLNGPAGCISAYGSFIIHMDLMHDIKGRISWNVYDITNEYDKLLQENVNGKKGSVIVNYAVFRDAVEAIVEVILFNGDGNEPAYIYGQITARNSNFTNESTVSTLFQKTLDENKKVSPGKHIPLSRSVVAVPLNSSLKVVANLFVHNGYKRQSEREIAKSTAEFRARCSGTFEKNIIGKYGRIRVKVTWTSYI